MRIERVNISPAVADKLARKHSLSAKEVYEVFWNEEERALIYKSDRMPGTYVALGRTEAGRYLAVAFAPQTKGQARVITARDMTKAERQLYRRERKR